MIKKMLKKSTIICCAYNLCKNKVKKMQIKLSGKEVLQDIHLVFLKSEIDYFIDFGTLLGYIRDNSFIKHDLDIDIGVPFSNEANKKLVHQNMIVKGFKKIAEYTFEGRIVEETYSRNGVLADLFYYESNCENSFCYAFYKDPDKDYSSQNVFSVCQYKYRKIEKFRTVNFMGATVSIPDKAIELIGEKYGENWKKPNKNWVYWKAPTSIYLDQYGLKKILE